MPPAARPPPLALTIASPLSTTPHRGRLQADDGGPPDPAVLQAACRQQRSGSAIPVLLAATCAPARLPDAWLGGGEGVVGMDGLALSPELLPAAAMAAGGPLQGPRATPTLVESVAPVLARLASGAASTAGGADGGGAARAAVSDTAGFAPSSSGSNGSGGGGGGLLGAERRSKGWAERLLDAEKGALLQEERRVLARALEYLQDVVPDLSEVGVCLLSA